jgi:hypothetical protein
VVAFVEGDAERTKEYGGVSLYLPTVALFRKPAEVPELMNQFFLFQSSPGSRWVRHFDEAGYLAVAFARWYWAFEQVEVAAVPYTSEYDWLVRCQWNDDYPVITRAN